MTAAGNRCDLVTLPGRKHAFFVPGYGSPADLETGREELLRFLISLGNVPAPTEISFPPRPRLTDLAQVETNRVVETLEVPEKEAQWIFYYACPKDNTRLRPESTDRHICPTCREVYTDERTSAAYRCLLHDQLNNQCLNLATVYGLTGDVKYAEPVRAALLELARLYPTWPRHDRWGGASEVGGRRYSQQLDEAYSIIRLARAYDLVADAPCFSAADRQIIEDQFLGATAREILQYQSFTNPRHNHQTWYNAAYTVVGVAIGDAALIREGIHGQTGLLWQIDNSITDDGLWYEGAMAYHFYALDAIRPTLEAARRIGWDFSGNARLRSLWEGPVKLAYPNGQFPAINDSDLSHLGGYGRHFQWARRFFGQQFPTTPATNSAVLADAGLVALRRGGACAFLDFGQHGDEHGHYDKLNLTLYANGREWLLDPGRLSYSVPEYKTWVKTTAAHNTVTLAGRNQAETTGRLLWFKEGDGWSACAAETDQAYPGSLLRRYLLLTGDFLVDVFEVTAGKPTQIDWFAHALSQRLEPAGTGDEIRLGEHDGYPHLTGARKIPADVPWEFVERDRRLRVWVEAGEEAFTATAIGYTLKQLVPTLIRRRQAATPRFVTVYDWSGTGRALHAPAVFTTATGTWHIDFTSTGVSVEVRP